MRTLFRISFVLSLCLLMLSCNLSNKPALKNKEISASLIPNTEVDYLTTDSFTIQKAHTVQNLTLFMITGHGGISGKVYKTLSEAMDAKDVVVKETGSVNELFIDNNSDHYIFIHSGDIVKGGKQDRTISFDIIIPPRTKGTALQSFCVEQGRWQKRSEESVSSFGMNSKMLSSRDLKLAAKYKKDQNKVWSKVSEQKKQLNKNLSERNGYMVDVGDNESDSSLQLALESKELEKAKKEFYDAFNSLINTPRVIGYAYAINGKIYGVEVYNNKQLFRDLWEKILESLIVEAISIQADKAAILNTIKDVIEFIEAVNENDKRTVKHINELTNFKTIENELGSIIFITEDLNKKKWIHKSYIKIDSTEFKQNKNTHNSHQRN